MKNDWNEKRETFDIAFNQATSSISSFDEWFSSPTSDKLQILMDQRVEGLYSQQLKVAFAAMELLCDADEQLGGEVANLDQIQSTLKAGKAAISMLVTTVKQVAELTIEIPKKHVSIQNKSKADRHHDRPGGSRDNATKMLQFWASGKYKSRQQCANLESAGLKISSATALKYLRNSPEPIRR